MLALAAAIVFQNAKLPEKAIVAYSGIPTVANINTIIQSHSVTLTISKDHVDVASLTLVKNNGPAATIPVNILPASIGGASVPTGISATWANAPVKLNEEHRMDQLSGQPPLYGNVSMQNLGTYALRVKYTVPLGTSGFDHKQRIAAYDLSCPVPIGTLMVTYTYAPGVVFHEPEAGPHLGWQIGLKGAFLKLTNYDGKAGLSYCAFYPAGFGGK